MATQLGCPVFDSTSNREQRLFESMQFRQRKQHEKKMRRHAVKSLIHNNRNVRLQYIRDDEQRPLGVVVSQLNNDGNFLVGYSKMHPKDVENYGHVYDRDLGILNALNNMHPVGVTLNDGRMPEDVRRTVAYLMYRNSLYYKGA